MHAKVVGGKMSLSLHLIFKWYSNSNTYKLLKEKDNINMIKY